jgi:hypothetical protein
MVTKITNLRQASPIQSNCERNPDTSSGNTFGYTKGFFSKPNGNLIEVPAGTVIIPEGVFAIWFDLTSETIKAGTAAPGLDQYVLYDGINSGGIISNFRDFRSWATFGLGGGTPLDTLDTTISNLNPTHWYKMNETVGTTATDSGSGSLNGTITGTIDLDQPGPTPSTSAFGFDGTTSEFIDFASALTASSVGTITAFINIDASETTAGAIYAEANNAASSQSFIFSYFKPTDFALNFNSRENGSANQYSENTGGVREITGGGWHNVTISQYDTESGVRLWIDGEEIVGMTRGVTGTTNIDNWSGDIAGLNSFTIGRRDFATPDTPFFGLMSNVAFWDSPLTPGEIESIATASGF